MCRVVCIMFNCLLVTIADKPESLVNFSGTDAVGKETMWP